MGLQHSENITWRWASKYISDLKKNYIIFKNSLVLFPIDITKKAHSTKNYGYKIHVLRMVTVVYTDLMSVLMKQKQASAKAKKQVSLTSSYKLINLINDCTKLREIGLKTQTVEIT